MTKEHPLGHRSRRRPTCRLHLSFTFREPVASDPERSGGVSGLDPMCREPTPRPHHGGFTPRSSKPGTRVSFESVRFPVPVETHPHNRRSVNSPRERSNEERETTFTRGRRSQNEVYRKNAGVPPLTTSYHSSKRITYLVSCNVSPKGLVSRKTSQHARGGPFQTIGKRTNPNRL